MLNIEKFTFEDYKQTPVEVTVWNRLPDTPSPVLCIDYHNVADTYQVKTLREASGLPKEPHAIVSLLYSHGTNFDDLREYAQRTGQLTVAIVFLPSKAVQKEQRLAVKGIKRRIVEKLGWTSARCALDDKPSLWMPSTEVETLKLEDSSKVCVFKIQWSGLSSEQKQKIDTEEFMCTHASLGACYQKLDSKKVKDFLKASNSRRAVTLRANNLAELEAVEKKAREAGINTYIQVDAGLTQVPAGTATVLAIGPDDPEKIFGITDNLKLY
jgi:PTH2 family peptidyl-tRNA hydrolase